jgi:Mg-chelatase subunit ChlD
MTESEHRRHCILVLDTSESMGASGIAGLRALALQVCRSLAPGDFLSIVLFSSQARIVLPPSPAGPLLTAHVLRVAPAWQAAGNTNLESGWLAAIACHRALPALETRFLITLDGRANEGAATPDELHHLGQLAAGARVAIFGLGLLCSLPQMHSFAAGACGEVIRVLLPAQLPAAAFRWLTPAPSARACTSGRCG